MKANTYSDLQVTQRRRRVREAHKQQVADQYGRLGGVMRIKRAIIPIILALSAAGSIAAGSTLSVAAASAPVAAHVIAPTYYHE
jgi:Mg-chelatase subunit ChlD